MIRIPPAASDIRPKNTTSASALCVLASVLSIVILAIFTTGHNAQERILSRTNRRGAETLTGTSVTITHQDLPTEGIRSHHAANLVSSAEGTPIAFWFGGTKEGATDVCIMRSEYRDGAWTPASRVLDAAKASHFAGRWIRKLGNPVCWKSPNGTLHLYVVTVCLGRWSGSRLLHLTSSDDGRTFTHGATQVVSPFFNFSTLVKSPVIDISGTPTLPVYHEFIRKRPLLLALDEAGDLQTIRGFGRRDSLLQPAVTRTADGTFLAVHRRYFDLEARVFEQTSENGFDWTPAKPANLPNPGSAVALVTGPDGGAIIAFNDEVNCRKSLRLAMRTANGEWQRVGPVIHSSDEVSYPALLSTPDALHLVFTRDRAKIVHYRIPHDLMRSEEPLKAAASK